MRLRELVTEIAKEGYTGEATVLNDFDLVMTVKLDGKEYTIPIDKVRFYFGQIELKAEKDLNTLERIDT